MFALKIKESALKELKKLPRIVREQIDQKLNRLIKDPWRSDLNIKKLKGHGLYRLRAQDYRVIYQLQSQQLVILVVSVGHRKEVYR